MKLAVCALLILAILVLFYSAETVWCTIADQEKASGNNFRAWTSQKWVQTTTTDFNAGYRVSNIDVGSGEMSLTPVLNLLGIVVGHNSPGVYNSQVLDTGIPGSGWDAIFWNANTPGGSEVSLQVRASDSPFLKSDTSLGWTSVSSSSPDLTGLPAGRYKQWRATLVGSGLLYLTTPTLYDVTVYYH